jgi:hypothetical protein
MEYESFSFYKFHSNDLVIIVCLQITFMVLGGVLSGFSGLRGLITNTAADIAGGAKAVAHLSFLEKLQKIGTVSHGLARLTLTWLKNHLIRLGLGVTLMSVGAIRDSWADGGVWVEMLIQSLTIVALYMKVKTHRMQQQVENAAQNLELLKDKYTYMKGIVGGFVSRLTSRIQWLDRHATALDNAADALEIAITGFLFLL